MFISSFWSKPLIWVQVSFPWLLVPYIFSFISLFIAFTFSSILSPYLTKTVSILITSVLNYASDRLAMSSLLSYIFSGALICSFIWAIFFFLVSVHLSCSKGQSLRCSPGWGKPHWCVVMLYVGEGVREGTMPLTLLSAGFQSLPLIPTNWAFLVLISR